MRVVLHIDFNSYFATVEQQANPRLRGKPIGVTGGDRLERTVVGAASVEAKRFGIKTGMTVAEALKLCPELILVKGDSDKYLSCTKKFLNIIKRYSPYVEVFSIDEVFLELTSSVSSRAKTRILPYRGGVEGSSSNYSMNQFESDPSTLGTPVGMTNNDDIWINAMKVAEDIKKRIQEEVGDWITCSIGISYNRIIAKLAGSLYKPDGLVVIADEESARWILDRSPLESICGIGFRVTKHLNSMSVFDFKTLRKVPLPLLLAAFKSYGKFLYNISQGIDTTPVLPFYEKEEVKSVGHRHTIHHDTSDLEEIKQIMLKLSELIARKLRAKKLVGKTIHFGYRAAFNIDYYHTTGHTFYGKGMQTTIPATGDGLDIFHAAWHSFMKMWQEESIRMVGISVSNLQPQNPSTMTFLEDELKKEKIINALDVINNKFGEFTLKRGVLLRAVSIRRKPNSFLADYRFKI